MSFVLIFREAWSAPAQRLFKPLLYTTITICLTAVSFLMCLTSGYDLVWILDLVICFALLLIFTNRKFALFSGIAGLLIALPIYLAVGNQTHYQTSILAYWSLALHVVMLIGCLFLFRQQDASRYRNLSGKLAHEASRSLSSVAISAEFLQFALPNLVTSSEWAYRNGYSGDSIQQEMLDELKDLPVRLQEMGQRTAKTLDGLLDKIRFSQENSEQLRFGRYFDLCPKCYKRPLNKQ